VTSASDFTFGPPSLPGERQVARSRTRRVLWVSLAVGWLALLILLAPRTIAVRTERQSIARLPAASRRAAFERSLANVSALCAEPSGLADYCRHEIAFLRAFPECDGACQARLPDVDRALPR